MISVKDFSVIYENILAVDNINIELQPGKIYGLIGPNGAGKSTLLKSIAGLIDMYEGEIRFNNKDIRKHRFWQKQQTAYAPEDVELLPFLTVREFLEMIATIRKLESADSQIDFLIDLLSLENKANVLINEISHGMRQKMSIAAALLGEVPFQFYDETVNGLDTVTLNALQQHLHRLTQKNCTIVVASHVLPLIKNWCDTVFVLDEGRLIKTLDSDAISKWDAQNYPQ